MPKMTPEERKKYKEGLQKMYDQEEAIERWKTEFYKKYVK